MGIVANTVVNVANTVANTVTSVANTVGTVTNPPPNASLDFRWLQTNGRNGTLLRTVLQQKYTSANGQVSWVVVPVVVETINIPNPK